MMKGPRIRFVTLEFVTYAIYIYMLLYTGLAVLYSIFVIPREFVQS